MMRRAVFLRLLLLAIPVGASDLGFRVQHWITDAGGPKGFPAGSGVCGTTA